MRKQPTPRTGTPLRAALDRVGDRWALLVVEALATGPRRFGDLQADVGAAPNILTDRLRRLEDEGVLTATPYSDRPVRFQYDLTAAGRELAEALVALAAWGGAGDGRPGARFHAACGTAVELRAWCPTCDRLVTDDESPSTYDL